jgi:putative tricarboxylic transport membrane protein
MSLEAAMKRVEYIPPLFFIGIGAVIMYQSLFNLAYFDAKRGAPGPGFLAFWLSVGLLLVSAGIIIDLLRQPAPVEAPRQIPDDELLAEMEREAEMDERWPDRTGWVRIGYLMIPFVVLLTVFEQLGFIVSASLYVMIAAYGLGYRKLPVLILASILSGVLLYMLFDTWLGVNLPNGILLF